MGLIFKLYANFSDISSRLLVGAMISEIRGIIGDAYIKRIQKYPTLVREQGLRVREETIQTGDRFYESNSVPHHQDGVKARAVPAKANEALNNGRCTSWQNDLCS